MSLANFDLNLLKVLDALLRESNTTKAAERVGLSQPAVSAALSRLRDRLGDPLFVRSGKGIKPTPFADTLRMPVQEVLARMEAIVEGPEKFDPETSDRVFRICGTDYFSEVLFPPLLKRLVKEAPNISLRLVDQLYETNAAAMQNLDIDIAFLPRIHFPEWMDVQEVCLTSFVIGAPKDNHLFRENGIGPGDPIPMEIYLQFHHASFAPEGYIQADGDLALANKGHSRKVLATFPTFGGIYSAIARGGMLGGLPVELAKRYESYGEISLHPLPVDLPPNHMCMIWNRSFTHDAAHRWLRQTIAKLLSDNSNDERSHTPGIVHV